MPTFTRIIPLLVYADLPAAHDFLVKAFGFDAGGIELDGEGNAFHAEVRAGAQVIWMHRVTADHALGSQRDAGTATSGLVVHVDDVDAHYAQARAAGASIDAPPEDRPYGQREYEARDPEGHRWWFATPVK